VALGNSAAYWYSRCGAGTRRRCLVYRVAQRSGHLGWFDPATGRSTLIALGNGSSPHGVIQGPDKAAWITDGGLGAIVRVGWPDRTVRAIPPPDGTPYANLNTCTFDGDGDLWFTGQSGVIGRLALKSEKVSVKDAPLCGVYRRTRPCLDQRFWRECGLAL
jgi:virginiamycin B lyase